MQDTASGNEDDRYLFSQVRIKAVAGAEPAFPTKLNDRNMNTIDAPKQRIKAALLAGIRLTTAQGNRLASTVDFRKIISRLREEGLEIKDFWNIRKDREGRTIARYKTYYIDSPLPAKGTRIAGFGEPEIEQLF